MILKITEHQAEDLIYEYEPHLYNEGDKFIVEYKSEWKGSGKYQYMEVIFKRAKEDGFFRLKANRTGSHYTEWYREYDLNCKQVERREKVTYEYVDCDPS